ncbi:adenosylcobinamide-GDP ribazoletransferase [Herbaspirillum rhizosphaerae]|uniref:adenosylcobinamide-GDP ribazoletransferase n=1 Tax=Herbaspirillum rhizosphaerae TaxID=346179 RepID=UPI00067DCCAB|nr:adenosylcobinamide-GDP ribazoletransferase [Herbaspirillum rhizosphaerae]
MSVVPSAGAGLRYQLRLFFTALQFFTRLPAPRWVGFDAAWLQHAVRYFPAVGILVGLVCATVYWLTSLLLPQVVAVLLSTAAGIYLTGAFHEDGFADVCDGFGGGMQASRVLEIMRDSRVGAYGVIGMLLLLGLKIAALASLPALQVAPALLLAHPVSRCLAAGLIWRMEYVREEGKVKPLAQQMNTFEFAVATLTACLPVAACMAMGWFAWQGMLLALLLGLAATVFLAHKFRRRIGGYTGDCLGAVQQLSEVAIYLGLLAAVSAASSL